MLYLMPATTLPDIGRAARWFHALSDATRLEIVGLLSHGERGACGCASDPVSGNLYDAAETAALPEGAVRASLGCGNPAALAELHAGEVVLDLGSGGGIDVLLSAQRVGPTGKAYGLDMTDEMLALARANQHKAGVANVEFLKGEIERIPLPDASVDVVISNCVINLSASTRRLSADRLMTQFEMTTSTDASGNGMRSISPFRNSTFATPALC